MSEIILQICAQPRWRPRCSSVGFMSHIKGTVTVQIQLQRIPRSPKAPVKPSDFISPRPLHKHKSEELPKRRVGKQKEATPPTHSPSWSGDITHLGELPRLSAPTDDLRSQPSVSRTEWLTPVFCGFIIFANLLLNVPNDIMSNSLQVGRERGSDRRSFISTTSIIHLHRADRSLSPLRSYLPPYVLNSGSVTRPMTSCCLLYVTVIVFFGVFLFLFFFNVCFAALILCFITYHMFKL